MRYTDFILDQNEPMKSTHVYFLSVIASPCNHKIILAAFVRKKIGGGFRGLGCLNKPRADPKIKQKLLILRPITKSQQSQVS